MFSPRKLIRNAPLFLFLCSLVVLFFYIPQLNSRPDFNQRAKRHEIIKQDTFLLVMVVSQAEDFKERNEIRNSWFKFKEERFMKFFPVANVSNAEIRKKLIKERDTYKDIVILDDVMEGENRYESKRVLRAFKHAYLKYSFSLLKVDKGTFVVIPKLVEYLHTVTSTRAYIGVMNGVKFMDDFYGEGFVNYMFAPGYVLGSDIVGYFGRSQHLMRYYDWEDVTIGAHVGFIKFLDEDSRFACFKTSFYCYKEAIVTAKASDHLMEMYTGYKTFENQCALINKEL